MLPGLDVYCSADHAQPLTSGKREELDDLSVDHDQSDLSEVRNLCLADGVSTEEIYPISMDPRMGFFERFFDRRPSPSSCAIGCRGHYCVTADGFITKNWLLPGVM